MPPAKKDRRDLMAIGDGVLVALFCMGMVFLLLTVVYGMIRLSSAIIGRIEARGPGSTGRGGAPQRR
jgi:Na+-transporting methylmalonyl-CoA/oxaloacetate decarboxylase gamma subunit